MTKTIWVMLVVLVAAASLLLYPHKRAAPPLETEKLIHYTQAREHAGQTVTVWGTIRNVFNNRLAVYLGFTEPRRGSFFVRIPKEDWGNFPQHPETLYRPGQTICVRGRIVWYQGDPIIYVRHPCTTALCLRGDLRPEHLVRHDADATGTDPMGRGHALSQPERFVRLKHLSLCGKYFVSSDTGDWNAEGRPTLTVAWGNPTSSPPPSSGSSEWTQHAHNAQRTSYTDHVVPLPWRWKWAWNGPTSSGGISPGKFGLPRNSQPVTGDGRVYIAAGSNGVYALNNANGSVVWNRNFGSPVNSTPAYDLDTNALFVVAANGVLYKLNAATGATLGQFSSGSSSTLPLPPAVISDRVFFSMGTRVYAINKQTMAQIWSYNAGVAVHTPPAYSPSRNRVIVATEDLYVHAINNATGTQAWRVKPTVRTGGDPADNNSTVAEVKNGWPVIAEGHGYVLIKLRLDWQALWDASPWPADNAAMRAYLQQNPEYQALFVLDLDDGSVPFIANVGHGGFGDGGYLPMGPQPVVKRYPNGNELVYTVIRGRECSSSDTSCDGRWDSQLGEMVLDNTTVSGYQAGYVRFMQNTFFPTDEQVYVSMADDYIFGGHWEVGIAHRIVDRSPARGTFSNPIVTENLPHIVTSQDTDVCMTGFSATHYCDQGLINTRSWPAGFYIYWGQGAVYDQYWSEYATWVVSNNTVYFVSTDGTVVALESATPQLVCPGVTVTSSPPSVTYRRRNQIIRVSVTINNNSGGSRSVTAITKQADEPFTIISISPSRLPYTISNRRSVTFFIRTRGPASGLPVTATSPYFNITLDCGTLSTASMPVLKRKLHLTDLRAIALGKMLIISASGEGIAGISVKLYDLLGRLVLKAEGEESLLRVDPLKLTNGVYLYVVRVRGFNGEEYVSEVRKLVILH